MYFYHCESFVGASFSLPSPLPLSCNHRRESSVNTSSSLPLFHNHQYIAWFAQPSSPRCSCWHWSIERATHQIQAPIVISWRRYCSEISASSLNYVPLLSASCGFEHWRFHPGLCAAVFLLDFVLQPSSSRDNQGAH